MTQDRERMKELLDAHHTWPTNFAFKFIVPVAQQGALSALFPPESIAVRPSSGGRYVSLTVTLKMASSEEVLEVYARASKIPGLIAL